MLFSSGGGGGVVVIQACLCLYATGVFSESAHAKSIS